ncbi:MAG: hypothetical protein COA75_02995 [Cellvibrionales bacterium]|nr:MAG: hypothetical protein COA75_02995 [Cellvibrionales bacterium]
MIHNYEVILVGCCNKTGEQVRRKVAGSGEDFVDAWVDMEGRLKKVEEAVSDCDVVSVIRHPDGHVEGVTLGPWDAVEGLGGL